MPSAVVARVASSRSSTGRSRTRPSVDLRLVPSRIGQPRTRSAPRSRTSARFCSGVLPKPKPRIHDQVRARHAEPLGTLDGGVEIGDDLGDEVAIAWLGAVVHHHQRDVAFCREPGERVVRSHAPDVVEQVGAGIEGGRGDPGLGRVDAERHPGQRGSQRGDHRHARGRALRPRPPRRGPAAWIRRRRRAGPRHRRPSGDRARRRPAPGRPGPPGGRRPRTSRA